MGTWGTGKILKTCGNCSIEFYARKDRPGLFCSKSCSARKSKRKKSGPSLICKICSNLYYVKPYRKFTSVYCSRLCLAKGRGENMRGEKHPKWKGGVTERPFFSRQKIRQRKKDIGKCEECGSTEKLEGHHIHGFFNDGHQIIILCAECHSLKHPKLKNFIRRKYDNQVDFQGHF